jgi:hypothetical protein
MRSSLDEALRVFKKFQDDSTFVRLVVAIKGMDGLADGRIEALSDADGNPILRVRGRGCFLSVPLSARDDFEYFEPREFAGDLSKEAFASFSQIVIEGEGLATVAEFLRRG